MVSKTFCILPWIHFYANPDGNVLPCCIGDHNRPLGNVQTQSITEVWNSDNYKQMRLNMLSGDRCVECKSCYQSEDAGVNSFRQSVNRDYVEFLNFAEDTNPDGSLDTMKLKYLDIRWSNICNFKCRSCSSTYSSSWATEDNKQGQNKQVFIFAGGKNNDLLYEQIKPYIAEVKEIYFAGGEPLLMDKHYDILEHLIVTGNTNIKIRYNSNLSSLTFKQTSILDLWKQFSNIHLNVSVDSWHDRAEYIREGTVWNILEQNIKTVKAECPHIYIGISAVISAFNVHSLPEFIEYMSSNQLVDSSTTASFYCLINPNFYSFDIFDSKTKNNIIEKLSNRQYNNHIKPQIENVIKHLKSSTTNLNLQKQFKKHTDYYDSIRNKKFIDTFPELKEFYENIL
jgi:radical SAM protein with 4Fe4S-binding SPASM domain